MTVGDDGRQGVFSFEDMLKSAKGKIRPKVRQGQGVPWERVKVLADVRVACGIKLRDINEMCDLGMTFISKVLLGKQEIRPEEFDRLRAALADIVFERIVDAAKGYTRA
ncbi:MAG: hypothetical protein IJR27_07545 [Synergistaceae bacterium]|nr:hypothetical protein [Synergistaceae bacterium]